MLFRIENNATVYGNYSNHPFFASEITLRSPIPRTKSARKTFPQIQQAYHPEKAAQHPPRDQEITEAWKVSNGSGAGKNSAVAGNSPARYDLHPAVQLQNPRYGFHTGRPLAVQITGEEPESFREYRRKFSGGLCRHRMKSRYDWRLAKSC